MVFVSDSIGDDTRGPMVRYSVSCRARTTGDRRIVSGPVGAKHGTSLRVLGLGCLQVLVRDVDLRFETIQLRILKNLPPVAAQILAVRLTGFQIAPSLKYLTNW